MTIRINSLTREMKDRMPVVAEKWRRRAFMTTWDRERARDAALRCYDAAGFSRPREVVLADSPMAALHEIQRRQGSSGSLWCPPHDGAGWCYWRATFDYFRPYLPDVIARAVPQIELDESGAFWWWWFRGLVVLCGPPEFWRYDQGSCDGSEPFRLHCEDGPAARWPDGYEIYLWRGIPIPNKEWILNPESITRDVIFSEQNDERRRAATEILGPRLIDVLGAMKISSDEFGTLYEIHEDRLADEPIRCVHVTCPSTGREYLRRVPPNKPTAHAAVAWTAGIDDPAEYRPIKEA